MPSSALPAILQFYFAALPTRAPIGTPFAYSAAMSLPHRKRVKHYDVPGHIHELTFSCYQRWALLTEDHCRELLSQAIERAVNRHRYRLAAFVFMPDHVHLLVWPEANAAKIHAFLWAIKRPVSYRIKKWWEQTENPWLSKLTIRQRPNIQTFRFWQEGPGYDRNLTNAHSVSLAIDYIHANPVRRGLCSKASEWRWSSAGFYLSEEAFQVPGLPQLTPLPATWWDDAGVTGDD